MEVCFGYYFFCFFFLIIYKIEDIVKILFYFYFLKDLKRVSYDVFNEDMSESLLGEFVCLYGVGKEEFLFFKFFEEKYEK